MENAIETEREREMEIDKKKFSIKEIFENSVNNRAIE